MTKIRHVDFYADEFLAGTATLDVVDVGVYWIACAMIYSRGGPIEIAELKRFVRCHAIVFDNALRRLVEVGKLIRDGTRVTCERCLNELGKAVTRVEKWARNGSKGGRPSNKINEIAKPSGFHARAKVNQEPKERFLESKTQDSVAPLPRARAHEGGADEGPPEPSAAADAERRAAGERDAPAAEDPPLTAEERAEMARQLDEVMAGLAGGTPTAAIVRDPAAHETAIRQNKRDAWLRELHEWASGRLEGEQRMQAWEAIHCALAAGSRDATPKPVRKYVDRLDSCRKAETSQLRGAA